ncbi:hypothetical protein [Teredinibacter turnerae]|uniref:hypothetical protein n=1 Tax=Teredinibacter turnerae TaxID=2426 RepID=UPI0003AA39DD|nr:hypothetical protein [Teredinibacter turnerae]
MKAAIYLVLLSFPCLASATAYNAVYGEYESGNHSSAYSACMALGAIIYPDHYSRPVTGATSTPTSTTSSSCATDVSYAVVGNLYYIDEECSDPDENGLCSIEIIETCEDGFPPDLLGYYGCDRPAIKQCDDGSYVTSNTFCPLNPTVCTDFDTCYNYALSDASCTGATYFSFNYVDPQNFSFECTVIDSASPDNPDNGGNADGNIYNDPTSPTTASVSEIDPGTLADAIDNSLRDDFGNVERAVREGSADVESAVRDNTQILKDAIEAQGISTGDYFADMQTTINNAFGQLETTNNSGSSDIVDSVNGVKASVDAGNTTLTEISCKFDDLKDCEPTIDNNYCENPHGLDGDFIGSVSDALQGTMDQEREDAVQTVKDEISELKDSSPFGSELTESNLESLYSYFTDVWPAPTACIPLEIGDSSQPFGHITISCEFSDKFKATFGFLISIYTILSLIDILMSPIKPKLNGGV